MGEKVIQETGRGFARLLLRITKNREFLFSQEKPYTRPKVRGIRDAVT